MQSSNIQQNVLDFSPTQSISEFIIRFRILQTSQNGTVFHLKNNEYEANYNQTRIPVQMRKPVVMSYSDQYGQPKKIAESYVFKSDAQTETCKV